MPTKRPAQPRSDFSPKLNTGFTLIELVVVTGLISMLLITISSMFMATLTSNLKTTIRQQIKEEGGYVLSQIEFMLRNSAKLEPNSNNIICATGMKKIKFSNPDGFTTELSLSGGQIASNSATLHSSSLFASNLNFDCARNPGGEYYVDTLFSLSEVDIGISENFGHMILLRN